MKSRKNYDIKIRYVCPPDWTTRLHLQNVILLFYEFEWIEWCISNCTKIHTYQDSKRKERKEKKGGGVGKVKYQQKKKKKIWGMNEE